MSLVRFDVSIVRVKQSFIVSQIVSDVQSSSRVLSKYSREHLFWDKTYLTWDELRREKLCNEWPSRLIYL